MWKNCHQNKISIPRKVCSELLLIKCYYFWFSLKAQKVNVPQVAIFYKNMAVGKSENLIMLHVYKLEKDHATFFRGPLILHQNFFENHTFHFGGCMLASYLVNRWSLRCYSNWKSIFLPLAAPTTSMEKIMSKSDIKQRILNLGRATKKLSYHCNVINKNASAALY